MSEAYFKSLSALKGPVLSLLKKEGYQAVDMHYHSKYSIDGLANIKQIVNKCKIDSLGLAITDHNNWRGSIKAKYIAHQKVFVIPGIEVTCHNGVHILLHFSNQAEYKEFFDKNLASRIKLNPWFINLTHEEVVDLASQYNCLITAPHPYGPGFCGIKKFRTSQAVLNKIQAIEAINGCCLRKMNEKAIIWGEKINKSFIAGSDGHCLAELGTAVTICQANTPEEFLEQIKKKKSLVMGQEEKILGDMIHNLEKFVREEENVPSLQLINMWKERGILEWKNLTKKLRKKDFLSHYHSHHQEQISSKLIKHKYTKHLLKYSKN